MRYRVSRLFLTAALSGCSDVINRCLRDIRWKKVYFGDQGLMATRVKLQLYKSDSFIKDYPRDHNPPRWSLPWPAKTLAGCDTLIIHLPGLLSEEYRVQWWENRGYVTSCVELWNDSLIQIGNINEV